MSCRIFGLLTIDSRYVLLHAYRCCFFIRIEMVWWENEYILAIGNQHKWQPNLSINKFWIIEYRYVYVCNEAQAYCMRLVKCFNALNQFNANFVYDKSEIREMLIIFNLKLINRVGILCCAGFFLSVFLVSFQFIAVIIVILKCLMTAACIFLQKFSLVCFHCTAHNFMR